MELAVGNVPGEAQVRYGATEQYAEGDSDAEGRARHSGQRTAPHRASRPARQAEGYHAADNGKDEGEQNQAHPRYFRPYSVPVKDPIDDCRLDDSTVCFLAPQAIAHQYPRPPGSNKRYGRKVCSPPRGLSRPSPRMDEVARNASAAGSRGYVQIRHRYA